MVLTITVKKIAPLMYGRVMLLNVCQPFAPSILAASYSSSGTLRKGGEVDHHRAPRVHQDMSTMPGLTHAGIGQPVRAVNADRAEHRLIRPPPARATGTGFPPPRRA